MSSTRQKLRCIARNKLKKLIFVKMFARFFGGSAKSPEEVVPREVVSTSRYAVVPCRVTSTSPMPYGEHKGLVLHAKRVLEQKRSSLGNPEWILLTFPKGLDIEYPMRYVYDISSSEMAVAVEFQLPHVEVGEPWVCNGSYDNACRFFVRKDNPYSLVYRDGAWAPCSGIKPRGAV